MKAPPSATAKSPPKAASRSPGTFGISIILVLIILASAAVYLNSIGNEFIFDDLSLVRDNKTIRSFANIKKLFLGDEIFSYRALRAVSYMIDYKIGKDSPRAYHVSNIFYHCICTLLVYFIIMRLLSNRRAALIGALIFGLHPIHVDAVAYISGRRDVLSTLFYLWGFLAFIKYRQTGGAHRLALSLFLYLCAMLVKEMAVTLPAAFFLYDLYREYASPQLKPAANGETRASRPLYTNIGRVLWRHKFFYVPVVIVGLFVSVYYIAALKASLMTDWWGGNPVFNFMTVFRILAYYIYLLFFPLRLVGDYSEFGFPLTQSYFQPAAWAALAFLLAVIWLGIMSFRRNPVIGFCIFWFFLTLLPVCHIVPHHEIMAEHYLYLPSFSFALLVGFAGEKAILSARWKKAAIVFLILLCVFYSGRTYFRNMDYRNPYVFWRKTVTQMPNCARAQCNYAIELAKRNITDEAEKRFFLALQIKPNQPKAHNNLGTLYMKLNRPEEGIRHYRAAVELKPDYVLARAQLAKALFKEGKLEEARAEYSKLFQLDQADREAIKHLGILSNYLKEYKEAAFWWDQLLKINPDDVRAIFNLANAYKEMGELDKAIRLFNLAILKNPKYFAPYVSLGAIYQAKGDFDKAVYNIERGLKVNPQKFEGYWALGLLYFQAGKYEKAIEKLDEARKIEPKNLLLYEVISISYRQLDRDDMASKYEDEFIRLARRYPEEFERYKNLKKRQEAYRVDSPPASN